MSSAPFDFPVTNFAGSVAIDSYTDTPGQEAVFINGDRHVLFPNPVQQLSFPTAAVRRDCPIVFNPANVAGKGIVATPQLLAWVPNVGLIELRQVMPVYRSFFVDSQGKQIVSMSGVSIVAN